MVNRDKYIDGSMRHSVANFGEFFHHVLGLQESSRPLRRRCDPQEAIHIHIRYQGGRPAGSYTAPRPVPSW